jgi:hypothetical protein
MSGTLAPLSFPTLRIGEAIGKPEPRRRSSRLLWIPAFAGMTRRCMAAASARNEKARNPSPLRGGSNREAVRGGVVFPPPATLRVATSPQGGGMGARRLR